VIGAGPAGAVTARELARRGLVVRLVDKATFPRAKVCGCCLNRAALGALEKVGLGHVPAACGAVSLRDVRIGAGRYSARVELPGGVALSREAFDAALVREAVAVGVEFSPSTPMKLADALVSARVVAEDAPAFFTPGTIHMATGRGGYVGLVRLEDGRLDIAAALDPALVKSAGGVGHAADGILKSVGWPADFAELPWKGTLALTRTPRAISGDRWFAVGDAAGYVEPFTGEGMAWAVASAAALAPIAARGVNWDDTLIREWERTHARVVGRRQRVCRVVAKALRHPVVTGVAVRTLAALPFLSRPVVALLNRPHESFA
jgi:flavin-dependent dehydrogenase